MKVSMRFARVALAAIVCAAAVMFVRNTEANSKPPAVRCSISSVSLSAEFDGHTYMFTSVAVCSNGGATLAGHRVTRIEEDDPRWDCHTMGNRICGPHLK